MKIIGGVGMFILFSSLTLFSACKESPAIESKTNEYFFYPKTNIYYDGRDSSYFYSLDSGRNWRKMKDQTRITPSTLGGRISIQVNENPIWQDNAKHRELYGGVLYNILTKDTQLLASNIAKESRKSITPSERNTNTITEEKKKNIFQRIFGKKKKTTS